MNIVVSGLKTMSEANPFAPAVISAGRQLTYGELFRLVSILGNFLAGKNVAPRTKVFLNILEPDLRLVVSVACLHARLLPFILLDPAKTDGADYQLVIGSPEPQLPGIKPDLLIDQSVIEGPSTDAAFREFGDIEDEDIFYIATTSGTTGRPKLVAATYGGFRTSRNSPSQDRKASPIPGLHPEEFTLGDRVLSSIGDVTKYGFSTMLHILAGGATLIRPQVDPLENLKAIQMYRATHVRATPSAIGQLVSIMEESGQRCPTVRWIELTGSLFSPALLARIEKCFDAEIRVSYGSAEVGGVSKGRITSATFASGYVGELLPGVDVASAGTPEEPGPVVIVKRADSYDAYYRDGVVTRHQEAAYMLPDLGYLVGMGLFLSGRNDEVFNFSGNKVAFSRIEFALRQIPGVTDVGLATRPGRTELVVGVVGKGLDVPKLTETVGALLNDRDAVAQLRIAEVAEIQRSALGKIDRAALLKAVDEATVPAESPLS